MSQSLSLPTSLIVFQFTIHDINDGWKGRITMGLPLLNTPYLPQKHKSLGLARFPSRQWASDRLSSSIYLTCTAIDAISTRMHLAGRGSMGPFEGRRARVNF